MNLSSRESGIVFRIMAELSRGHGSRELRERVGPLFLRLLDAQFFASYVWSDRSATFEERVAVNMTDENLRTYESHYQFCDPITPILQRRRRATAVAEIISRRGLESTEFFNDFLARDGLHFGMNYYAYAGGLNIGDVRIWRARNREDFSRREVEILDAIGPAFTNAMRTALAREGHDRGVLSLLDALDRVQARPKLTRREKEIAMAAVLGKSDREIADECGSPTRRCAPTSGTSSRSWGCPAGTSSSGASPCTSPRAFLSARSPGSAGIPARANLGSYSTPCAGKDARAPRRAIPKRLRPQPVLSA